MLPEALVPLADVPFSRANPPAPLGKRQRTFKSVH
jgi:hypothetical protein